MNQNICYGKLNPQEATPLHFALFSLPEANRIRCQCTRKGKPCNRPIYAKVVFITDGKDYCVQGVSCTEAILKKQGIKTTASALKDLPSITPEQLEEINALIEKNIGAIVPYLRALRDRNEAVLLAEEKRLGARRLPMNNLKLEALNLRRKLALEQVEANRREKDVERQNKADREKKFATAHSLTIRMANWFNIQTAISDVMAYADGRMELHHKVVDEIYSNDAYALLRRQPKLSPNKDTQLAMKEADELALKHKQRFL